ncbi:serine/threonine-protein kinase [Terracoccus luteus]|uniref:Serine/threonine protein kinase n=1 Tax=Terracoccus luteus TaxID=53356 RepID=A0A839PXS2_9MICO|nr:serine/threonine-protein kinase [Terracoccus luteus]MBB2986786.1 serine/threonine protein kinase [Terracoccus luteus]MCP2172437.1 serine/threonine protein kinase [Terracoccus luteus]
MPAHDRTEWVPTPSGAALTGSGDPYPRHERLGPYRLIEEIGEGGMGVVHLALDPRGRAVAIKVLRAHVAHDSDARTRLGREVETLSRIRDPRVASVIDADVMGPRPYIVTRYVPGTALDEAVEQGGPLRPDALLRLARGTAEAIRSIHACGVVHRDIKPGNVLLEDGEPVLIDFGIAHLQDDVRHTVGGLVMGTPGYLSPELVEGARISDATDWWGWAATITYAAAGRPPFGRGRMDAVLSRVRAGEVDLAGVDPRLAPLLQASLSPRPERRPHADEVIDALERFAHGEDATVGHARSHVGTDDWDATEVVQVEPPPAGSTQVLTGRSTNVMPAVEPAASTLPAGSAGPAVAGAAHSAVDAWAGSAPSATSASSGPSVPRGPMAAPTWEDLPPSVPAGAHGPRDGRDDGPPESSGSSDPLTPPRREGDPRIGLPMRTGLLAGVATGWLGALAAWPGVALLLLLLWSVVARATDRTVTGLVLRRYENGRRRSDVPWALGLSPWHVVLSAVATVVGFVLPLAVALAGVFASALLLAGAQGGELQPGDPLTLVVGGGLGLLMAWWGPAGASLRRGSRSITRVLVPEGVGTTVAGVALVGFGLVAAVAAVRHGTAFDWTPWTGNPLGG